MATAAELNAAYTERNCLIALLAAIYPATWNYADENEPDWAVVYLDLPTGQASWHIHRDDMVLFEHVQRDDTTIWDGHTTEEKYQRIGRLVATTTAARSDEQ